MNKQELQHLSTRAFLVSNRVGIWWPADVATSDRQRVLNELFGFASDLRHAARTHIDLEQIAEKILTLSATAAVHWSVDNSEWARKDTLNNLRLVAEELQRAARSQEPVPVYTCVHVLPNGRLCGYVQRGPGACPYGHLAGSTVPLVIDPVYKEAGYDG